MPKFSVVIPVYNRPDELEELLSSLSSQTFTDFEILIVEDGSTITSEKVVSHYQDQLSIKYLIKENGGQGFARNYGFEHAEGQIITVFDSDCIIPPSYFQIVNETLKSNDWDVYGGPDAADSSFTRVQKAIDHVMTSFLTTGGIRGRKTHVGKYHPRSFNMGLKKKVYEETGGYRIPYMGEDLEWSVRLIKSGYKSVLIPNAFVYHKRRTSLVKFFKQLFYFGRARINLSRFHSGEVKLAHLFPTFFTLGLLLIVALAMIKIKLWAIGLMVYGGYLSLILMEGMIKTRSIVVGILCPVVAILQLTGYGVGLIYELARKWMGINPNTRYMELY